MRLRETRPADLDIILSWVTSEADMVLWSGRTFTWPLDRGQLETYLHNDRRRYWTGLHPNSGEPVGHASLLVDDEARMMRLGCILLDPTARGRGLGRDLITAAVRVGFAATELPAMRLGVYAHGQVFLSGVQDRRDPFGVRRGGRPGWWRCPPSGRPWCRQG